MNKYTKALILYMYEKKITLMRNLPKGCTKKQFTNIEKFFTKKDKAIILSWDKDLSKKIFNYLQDCIFLKKNRFISPCTVFCYYAEMLVDTVHDLTMYYDTCNFCPYGKLHGVCKVPYSTYHTIIDIYFKYNINIDIIFTLEYYEKMTMDVMKNFNITRRVKDA